MHGNKTINQHEYRTTKQLRIHVHNTTNTMIKRIHKSRPNVTPATTALSK